MGKKKLFFQRSVEKEKIYTITAQLLDQLDLFTVLGIGVNEVFRGGAIANNSKHCIFSRYGTNDSIQQIILDNPNDFSSYTIGTYPATNLNPFALNYADNGNIIYQARLNNEIWQENLISQHIPNDPPNADITSISNVGYIRGISTSFNGSVLYVKQDLVRKWNLATPFDFSSGVLEGVIYDSDGNNINWMGDVKWLENGNLFLSSLGKSLFLYQAAIPFRLENSKLLTVFSDFSPLTTYAMTSGNLGNVFYRLVSQNLDYAYFEKWNFQITIT